MEKKMKFKHTTIAAIVLLMAGGCNASTDEESTAFVQNESFEVAVADGGPYAAPLPAGAKPKVVEHKEEGVKIYIPGSDDDSTDKTEAAPEEGMISDIGMSPRERVASTPKGKLKNPYTDDAEIADEGHARFMGNSCNGCHGGTGGGGMCPPLSNEVFVYGSDDDTLFRLITLGSDDLQKAGYFRKGMEGVVGPMPPFGDIIKTDKEVWEIITWIRTIFGGDPSRRNW